MQAANQKPIPMTDNNNRRKIAKQSLSTSANVAENRVLSCSDPAIFERSQFNKVCSTSLIAVLVIFLILTTIASCLILRHVIVRGSKVFASLDTNLSDFYRYSKSSPGAIRLPSNEITGTNVSLSTHSSGSIGVVPNLTALCVQSKGPCWFHPTVYPYSCLSTFCESVEYEVSLNESTSRIQFNPVVSLHRLDSTPLEKSFLRLIFTEFYRGSLQVPNRTPCGPQSWCMAGRCQSLNNASSEADQAALKAFQTRSQKPVNGGWSGDCGQPKCLVNKFLNKIHWQLLLMAAKCPGMPCSAYTKDVPRLLFRSCTNPLPANGGMACGEPDGPWPVVWGPVCQVTCLTAFNFQNDLQSLVSVPVQCPPMCVVFDCE